MRFKKISQLVIAAGAVLFLLFISRGCAQKGMPSGGPKDSIPPSFINSAPYNFSTDFSAQKIKIKFDEYIKLDNPQRQVIISPPIEPKPEIRPMGRANKEVTVILQDSLSENTTYTINFGKSIVDNTEENPLPFFKYVFSTGDHLDSLSLSGKVGDALEHNMKTNATVMLYEMDSTYTDSTIYEEPPTYLAYTKDTTDNFSLDNMRPGKYQMIALIDKNNNYTFEPKSDKIGYLKAPVTLPNDSTFNLQVFKEVLDFKMKRPKQKTKKHFIFGFEGRALQPEIKLLNAPEDFRSTYYKDEETDTLHYFYQPFTEADSLLFEVEQKTYKDTVEINPRDIEEDSLNFSATPKGNLSFHQNFKLSSNIPIRHFDSTRVEIRDKDSVSVDFSAEMDSVYNTAVLKFAKDEKQTYNIRALPGAITDFYGNQNDTLTYSLKTPAYTAKANLTLTFTDIKRFPVVVQLLNEKGEVQIERPHTAEEGNTFEFEFIDAGTYFTRVIYDDNGNGRWDPGNFMDKTQPEEVEHYRKELDLRKNWDVIQEF